MCEGDSDWCWLVSDKVLEVSSSDVGVHELEKTIGIRFLGETNGDWGWLVSDEVLEVPLVTLASMSLKRPSASDFISSSWTRP